MPSPREAAIERGIEFFAGHRLRPDALIVLHMLHRRFEIEALSGMPEAHDEWLLQRALVIDSDGAEAARIRVFRRLLFPENGVRPADLGLIVQRHDAVISPALYCDRMALPSDYGRTLRREAERGGYELTHVGLALLWMRDLGCEPPTSQYFAASVVERVAALPNADARIHDMELEAAALVYYLGRGDEIAAGFVDAVLAAQRPDGGWSADSKTRPNTSSPHPTFMALWLLLEVDRAGTATFVPPLANDR
jgi:hypothetical protein